jgi:RimJ/RimL family protein N-acetyltransferase
MRVPGRALGCGTGPLQSGRMLGPTLVGRSVTLGPLAPEHLSDYCRWFADPEVTRYLHRDNPPSLHVEQEWFDPAVASDSEVMWGLFAEGQHIGSVGLSQINWRHRRATTGTLIGDKGRWGRGIATRAMWLRTRYAFEARAGEANHHRGRGQSGQPPGTRACGLPDGGCVPSTQVPRGRVGGRLDRRAASSRVGCARVSRPTNGAVTELSTSAGPHWDCF